MIYLNNSATSYPKPKQVIDAVQKYLLTAHSSFARSGLERSSEDISYQCRMNLAKLFNIENPLNIAFSSGSTESLNTAIKGLDLKGSSVITTISEHNSVLRPLKTMERDGEIELIIIDYDVSGGISAESIENQIKANTKLIVLNHCSNVTGEILDIKSITEMAHKHNCLVLIDASQSAGIIDINCKDWEIDLLAFTGHKSLFALQGIGGLYVNPAIKLKPLKSGGTGTLSEYLYQPDQMPMLLEAGTPNSIGIASLAAGTEFILNTGIENIRKHKQILYEQMNNALLNYETVKIYSNTANNCYANFTFSIEGFEPEEINYYLDSSFDIIVRSGIHCAPLMIKSLGLSTSGTVRVSPSYFTSTEEIEIFIKAIKEIKYLKG